MASEAIEWFRRQHRRLRLKSHDAIIGYVLTVAIVAVYAVIFWRGSFENLPTTIFSTGTLIFAYFAYKFTRERFRLDLFEKRFAIYEAALGFCSRVSALGSIKAETSEEREGAEAAIEAAEESFRGIGYHKAKALFGEDIQELFEQLNSSYSWLISFTRGPGQSISHEEWVTKHRQETMFIWETATKLPDVFKPYMYFGDYKR